MFSFLHQLSFWWTFLLLHSPFPSSSPDLSFLKIILHLFVNGPGYIYFSWRQKSESTSSSSSIFRYGNQISLSLWTLAYQSTHTDMHVHPHTQRHIVTSTTKQRTHKALFDKSHQPKHYLFCFCCRSALHPFKLLFFPLCLRLFPLCRRLCVRPIVAGWAAEHRQHLPVIGGDERGKQGTQKEMIWTWRKVSEVYLWYVRLSKTKKVTNKQRKGRSFYYYLYY